MVFYSEVIKSVWTYTPVFKHSYERRCIITCHYVEVIIWLVGVLICTREILLESFGIIQTYSLVLFFLEQQLSTFICTLCIFCFRFYFLNLFSDFLLCIYRSRTPKTRSLVMMIGNRETSPCYLERKEKSCGTLSTRSSKAY